VFPPALIVQIEALGLLRSYPRVCSVEKSHATLILAQKSVGGQERTVSSAEV